MFRGKIKKKRIEIEKLRFELIDIWFQYNAIIQKRICI